MNVQSIARRFAVSSVLVATLAGILAAGANLDPSTAAVQRPFAGEPAMALPVLPEIVVTAPRLQA